MKRCLTIYAIAVCAVIAAAAQSWEEERDAIALNQYSPSLAQRQSANSLSSANLTKITKPVQTSNGRWTTQNAGFGRRTTYGGSSRGSSRSKFRGTGTHTSAPSKSFREQYRARREEQIRRAKIEQAKKRERIRRQNAEDFARGFTIHKAATAHFYARKAQRDHYMATEGAARLDASFTATDYATVPNRDAKPYVNTDTPDELADLLTAGGGMAFSDEAVVARQPFEPGDQFDANLSDAVNEADFARWNDAYNSSAFVSDNAGDSLRLTLTLILDAEAYDIDSLPRFAVPYMGFAFCNQDTIFTVTDKGVAAARWTSMHVDYLIGCGSRHILKDGNQLLMLNGAKLETLCSFNSSDFSIFPKDDDSFYVLLWYADLSLLYEVNPSKCAKTEIARIPELIWKVESSANASYIAVNNDIFLLKPDFTPVLFYRNDKRINDFSLTPEGMLIAFDDGIELIDEGFARHYATGEGVREIYNDLNSTYMFGRDGNVYKISFE